MSDVVFPVVDLFAGPGGLAEGFSAYATGKRNPFDVRLSIEKDAVACETLLLRKFFRSFHEPPEDYAAYLRGEIDRATLYSRHRAAYQEAASRTWKAELGTTTQTYVNDRVRQAIGRERIWALLGGPPCQAYSLVGRSRMKGRADFENDERHFLYREYLRIVATHRPTIFVMENVKGLLSAQHGGEPIIQRICADLQQPGRAARISSATSVLYDLYAVGAGTRSEIDGPSAAEFLVRAEDYGIPQMRHRIFIVGVRKGLNVRPRALDPLPRVRADEVLGDLPPIRSRISREPDSAREWSEALAEIRSQPWYQAGSEGKFGEVIKIARRVLADADLPETAGSSFVLHSAKPAKLAQWYRKGATGLTLHEARSHMRSDLWRYLFCACYGAAHGRSPHLRDFPAELHPQHKNLAEAIGGTKFGDRFRVQLKDRPSTTVTSHIAKDGHYFIHYAPQQCRSLTVREAARLQTFPDSYYFEGNRTQQFHQVGNAVPPLLASSIAGVVHEMLVDAHRRET